MSKEMKTDYFSGGLECLKRAQLAVQRIRAVKYSKQDDREIEEYGDLETNIEEALDQIVLTLFDFSEVLKIIQKEL